MTTSAHQSYLILFPLLLHGVPFCRCLPIVPIVAVLLLVGTDVGLDDALHLLHLDLGLFYRRRAPEVVGTSE